MYFHIVAYTDPKKGKQVEQAMTSFPEGWEDKQEQFMGKQEQFFFQLIHQDAKHNKAWPHAVMVLRRY